MHQRAAMYNVFWIRAVYFTRDVVTPQLIMSHKSTCSVSGIIARTSFRWNPSEFLDSWLLALLALTSIGQQCNGSLQTKQGCQVNEGIIWICVRVWCYILVRRRRDNSTNGASIDMMQIWAKSINFSWEIDTLRYVETWEILNSLSWHDTPSTYKQSLEKPI